MYCTRCGHEAADQTFCSRCGTPTRATAAGGDSPRRSVGPALAVSLLTLTLVIALGTALWVFLGTGGSPTAAAGSAATPAADTTPAGSPTANAGATRAAAPLAASSSAAPAPSGPGDVRTLPAGLFCRDLMAQGYSYAAAVDYWRLHGQPNQMDAERNGIPCETVYPSSDVTAYWGPRPQATYFYQDDTYGGLPSGMFCRDLMAQGYGYTDAVEYWQYWGRPDNMDADGNGIPCETVYSATDVAAYWGF